MHVLSYYKWKHYSHLELGQLWGVKNYCGITFDWNYDKKYRIILIV